MTGLTVDALLTAMDGGASILGKGFTFLATHPILLVPVGLGLLSAAAGWVHSRVR